MQYDRFGVATLVSDGVKFSEKDFPNAEKFNAIADNLILINIGRFSVKNIIRANEPLQKILENYDKSSHKMNFTFFKVIDTNPVQVGRKKDKTVGTKILNNGFQESFITVPNIFSKEYDAGNEEDFKGILRFGRPLEFDKSNPNDLIYYKPAVDPRWYYIQRTYPEFSEVISTYILKREKEIGFSKYLLFNLETNKTSSLGSDFLNDATNLFYEQNKSRIAEQEEQSKDNQGDITFEK